MSDVLVDVSDVSVDVLDMSEINPTNSIQRGSGIGDQFHRPPQNSIHVGGHANNRAPTTYCKPGPTVRAPSTVSVPPLRSQHGSGIDEQWIL